MQGFYFALLQYSHIQAFTACFVPFMHLYNPRHKTAHRALQLLFLRLCQLNRTRYQTDTNCYNISCDTLESAHTRPDALHRYQIPAPRRTLYRSAQPPIIIRWYIMVQGARPCYGSMPDSAAYRRPCQTGGSLDTSNARRRWLWHRSAVRARLVNIAYSIRRGSPAERARRAERNHWRLPPQLFSGFRPIANRGQQ